MLPCLPQCCVITIECCWKNPYFSFMSAPPCLFAFPFTPHFVIGASLQKPVWPLTLLEGDDSGVEDQSQNSSISKKSWVISQDICTLKYLSHPYYISVGLKIDFPNTLKIPISFKLGNKIDQTFTHVSHNIDRVSQHIMNIVFC